MLLGLATWSKMSNTSVSNGEVLPKDLTQRLKSYFPS